MDRRKVTSDTLVGLFVLTGIVLLNLVTFLIRDDIFGNTTRLKATFDSVPGLEVGAPVLVSGIRAGRVVAIDYKPISAPVQKASESNHSPTLQLAQPVVVVMRIKNKVPVYTNARVRLVQQGFIGDKRVEIDPGTSDNGELITDDSDPIPGETQMDLSNVMKKAEGVVDDLSATVHSLREVMTDEDNIASIRQTIANLNKSVDKIYAYLETNEANVQQTIADMKVISTNVREFSEEMKRFVNQGGRADQLVDNTDAAVTEMRAEMKATLDKAQTTIDSINEAVEKMDVRADKLTESATGFLDSTQDDFKSLSDNLERTSTNLNEVISSVRRGEGTVGRLMTDPAPFEDLKRSIEALREFLGGVAPASRNATLPYGLKPTAPESKAPAKGPGE